MRSIIIIGMSAILNGESIENPGLATLGEILGLTIPGMLERSARIYGDSPAMRAFDGMRFETISFNRLLDKVKALAAGLIARGIQPGDRVGILSENRPEWGMAYFASLYIGAVNVPLDSLLKPTEISHIIRESGARCVVISGRFISDFISEEIHAPSLDFIVNMDDMPSDDNNPVLEVFTFSHLVELGRDVELIAGEADIHDTVALLFTSGTTGQSKGVMLTHHNILSDIYFMLTFIDFYTYDNFLSVLPIHHAFECTCGFMVPLAGGASITYARSLKSREIIEDIKNNGCTIILGVPLLFEKMYKGLLRAIENKPARTRLMFNTGLGAVKFLKNTLGYNAGGFVFRSLREKAGLSSLRLLISGGAPLPPETGRGFELLGIKFLQGYGLTETSPVLTVNPPEKPKHDSIGVPIPGAELKIDDPDANGIGEILARGPMIMKGYYKNKEATREVMTGDGWFRTGDSGFVDNEGYYYIMGRKKNLIVTRAGKNIYPEEIEAVLIRSPYIAEVLVMGKSRLRQKAVSSSGTDSQLVEEVEAVVVPDYEFIEQQAELLGKDYTEDELRRIIKEEISTLCLDIADYKRVKSFKIREDEFNKTSTKKIKRYLFVGPSISVDNNKSGTALS